MDNNINISRRNFTIGAAWGLGGVVFGLGTAGELLANIQKFDAEKQAFALEPNIWLEIRKDNTVVITIPRTELGQGVRTSLSMLVAEELDADWEKIQPINAVGDAKYGNQSTGGSTSIRVFWSTLRTAGAQARLMLVAAAAQIWNISESNCYTDKSFVFEKNGSRSLSYGDLIDKASTLPIPPVASVKLKNPSEFKVIGKTKWHIDNPDIVTGKAKYSSDYKYDGMKYAVVLRSPEVGGSLKSFSDEQAKLVEGFIAAYKIPEGVAVVAESTYQAMKASEKIIAVWNPGPISQKSSSNITQELTQSLGTLPNLPAGTDKFIEALYEVPLLAHNTMEPMNAFAHYHDNKCEVWSMTQNPQTSRSTAASAVGLPESAVTANVLLNGGGFGRGHNNDFVGMAARISKLSGFPIKLQYTKSDCIKNDYYRPMSIHSLKTGIDKDKKITGWIHKVASQGSVSATNPFYNVPNIQNLTSTKNYSIPTGPWRSVNNTQLIFVNESMLDELAVLSGADPLQFRLNLTTNSRFKNVLQLAADKADWTKPLPENWGRGIAGFIGYDGFSAHVVEVSISKIGVLKIERIVAVVDCGIAINPGNIKAQFMGVAIDALSTSIKGEITVKNGQIEQSGFHDFRWFTMEESPKIEVNIVPSAEPPAGIGELGFPSVTPALCNAIFDACGIRVRKLPIKHTSLITSINENTSDGPLELNVYPNPVENIVNISLTASNQLADNLDLIIYDILGNKVLSLKRKFEGDTFKEQINMKEFSRGAYSLLVQLGNKKYIRKLIKN
jgi:CO/xanthine dehydrogenase Mo-binding subunit